MAFDIFNPPIFDDGGNEKARHQIDEDIDKSLVLQFYLKNAKDARVLDIGAYNGSYYAELLHKNGAKVIAVDIRNHRLKEKPRFERLNVQGNALELPFHDCTIDVVVSNLMTDLSPTFTDYKYSHLFRPQILTLLKEVHRVLVPGGLYSCGEYLNKYSLVSLFDEAGFWTTEIVSGRTIAAIKYDDLSQYG